MDNKNELHGAGGGDSKSSTREPDSLLSQDYFELVLAVGEGPIQGLVEGTHGNLTNFYAGSTPVVSASTGEANFSDFAVTQYTGRATDEPFTLVLGGSAANVPVSVSMASAVPVVRQTPGLQRNQFNRIEIRIRFEQLHQSTNDGVFEATALFQMEYKRASSTTWIKYQGLDPVSITGKTTSGYVKDFVIDVDKVNDDYDIRLTKVSPDFVQPGQNQPDGLVVSMSWESYQLVNRDPVHHPGLAMMHVHGKASNQFSSIPDFYGDYEGLIVRVPTNYNPVTRVYDETVPWNGTFKNAYVNCGVWILYELITNPVFGMARYYNGATADRYQFYEEAKWVDQMVPDGRGGQQPRYTYNDVLTEARGGMEALQYLAGSFGAVIVDDGNGVLSLVSDRPKTPSQVFTPENVSVEGFNYSFTDVDSRYNEVVAVFINPDLDWQEDRRAATIDNTEMIAKNGRRPHEFIAVGCTDANEAVRRANTRYITANYEVTTVDFITTRYGLLAQPHSTILVCDPLSDWGYSGRVRSVVGNTIHLRDPLFFTTTDACTMRVQTYDGLVDIQVVPAQTGENLLLTVTGSAPFPSNVPDKTVFTIQSATSIGFPKPFRVLHVAEIEGKPDKIQVTAIEIAENKHTAAVAGTVYTPSRYAYQTPGEPTLPSSLSLVVPPPAISNDGTYVYRIEASWRRPVGANTARFEIDFRRTGDSLWTTLSTAGDRAELSPAVQGAEYTARLYAITPAGVRSGRFVEATVVVGAFVNNLPSVQDLSVSAVATGWQLLWTQDPSINDYDATEFRRAPASSSVSTYDTHPVLVKSATSPHVIPWSVAGTYRLMAKHLSRSGGSSIDAVFVPWEILPPSTPVLTIQRDIASVLVTFQDCTTSQPLREIQVRTGPANSTWQTATPSGSAGANQRSVSIRPSATSDTRIFFRAVDAAGNESNIASDVIPAAAGSVGTLLDWISQGIPRDSLSASLLETLSLIDAEGTGLVDRVDGLVVTYGSTLSAAQSAANAAQSASDAAQAEADAIAAQAGAVVARDAAAGSATSAATSASNAATSATSASTAATGAAGSASSAATSATTASNAATSATNSASSAATSATSASSSATAAGNSATAANASRVAAESARDAAAGSASAAASSASTATTKATEAGQSATSASTSATNASTSATQAANSASAAGVSAGNASTSATNASTSASNAAGSAASASTSATAAANSATAAGSSASAAATSATTASTRATEAATSASSASASSTSASTSAASALTSSNSASTSATNAAGSANSAATSASSAATSLQTIQALATGFDANTAWNFDTSAEGFTASGASASYSSNDGGILAHSASGADPLLRSPAGLAIPGATAYVVRARVRRTSGTPNSNWQGALTYTTAGHGENFVSFFAIATDTTVLNDWRIVEWDISKASPTTWNDWRASTITQIRLDLAAGSGAAFDIDWIAVGRISPQAYAAQISQEASVRASADGHLGAQWSLKVGLVNGNSTAAIAGIAVAGTSSATAGAQFDMSFRANAFYFLPPAGQSDIPFTPLVYYATPTVVNGVTVPAGLYTRAAFIEYISADRIDTRNLTVKDAAGNVILSSGSPLQPANAATGLRNDYVGAAGGNLLRNPTWPGNRLDGWVIGNANGMAAALSPGNYGGSPTFKFNGVDGAYIHNPGTYVSDIAYCDTNSGTYNVGVGKSYQYSVLVNAHRSGVALFGYFLNSSGAIVNSATGPFCGHAGANYSTLPANGTNTATVKIAGGGYSGSGNNESDYIRLFFTTPPAPAGAVSFMPIIRMFQSPLEGDNYAFLARAMFSEVAAGTAVAVTYDAGPGIFAGGQKIASTNVSTFIDSLAINYLQLAGGSTSVSNALVFSGSNLNTTFLGQTTIQLPVNGQIVLSGYYEMAPPAVFFSSSVRFSFAGNVEVRILKNGVQIWSKTFFASMVNGPWVGYNQQFGSAVGTPAGSIGAGVSVAAVPTDVFTVQCFGVTYAFSPSGGSVYEGQIMNGVLNVSALYK